MRRRRARRPRGPRRPGSEPTGKAVGYAALLPIGTQGAVSATATGPRENGTSVGGLRPAGGGSIGSIRVSVRALTEGLRGAASGEVTIGGVSMLDGRVSIGTVRLAAPGRSRRAGGGLTDACVSGLTVDGVAVAAGPGSRVDVPGVGTLVFLEQVSDGAGAVRANGVRLEVTDAHAATVIGQPFVLGHLDLAATQGTAPVAEEPPEKPRPPPRPRSPARRRSRPPRPPRRRRS